jgi:Predicted N6-adenine-specific DNA methylase
LRLWDPFCGAGTIPLEAFSMFMEIPIRTNMEDKFLFKEWPVFNKEEYEKFKKSLEEKNSFKIPSGNSSTVSLKQVDVSLELYGSEIATKEYGKSLINFELLST